LLTRPVPPPPYGTSCLRRTGIAVFIDRGVCWVAEQGSRTYSGGRLRHLVGKQQVNKTHPATTARRASL